MRLVWITLGIALIAVILLCSFVIRQREPVIALAEAVCSGPRDSMKRVLVVGDSWARGGTVEPLGDTARVCALSYPGLTAAEVFRSLAADEDSRAAVGADLGTVTDAVVIAGVNDAIQHRGAAAYSQGVADLAAHLANLAPRVLVLELPPVRKAPQGLSPTLGIINGLFACLNDWCAEDVVAPYRAAAANLPVTLIRYEDVAAGLSSFAPDGVHLTPEGSIALGRVIAAAVAGSR